MDNTVARLLAAAVLLPLAAARPAFAGEKMQCQRIVYYDKQVSQGKVFSILTPLGWKHQGGLTWDLHRPALPGHLHFTVHAPEGPEAFTILPARLYFWTTDPWARQQFAPGSTYLGAEVRAPASAPEVLRHIVLPAHLKDASDWRIVALAKAAHMAAKRPPRVKGALTSLSGAYAIVAYTVGTVPVREYVAVGIEEHRTPVATVRGQFVNTVWAVSYNYAYRAPRDRLASPEAARTLAVLLGSFRFDKKWFNAYSQLCQKLAQLQIKRIKHINRLIEIIRNTRDEITEMAQDSYAHRMGVQEAAFYDFVDYLRQSALVEDEATVTQFEDALGGGGDMQAWIEANTAAALEVAAGLGVSEADIQDMMLQE